MSSPRLLLLSNSRNAGQDYLEHALGYIRGVLNGARRVAFVPYAGVTINWDTYAQTVRERLVPMGIELVSVHETPDPASLLASADAVAVGGGNTFRLLALLRTNGMLDAIRRSVAQGRPYIGWSAGANVACPTIKTTNDMPIVDPGGMDALGLVPFQINPHYLDAHPEGHQGETREQRLLEFVAANPGVSAVGLREGSALLLEGKAITLLGAKPIRLFRSGDPPREIDPAANLQFLLG